MSKTREQLFLDLRKAHSDVARAENELGGVNGSWGWNAAEGKVSLAEKQFNEALEALEDYIQNLESKSGPIGI